MPHKIYQIYILNNKINPIQIRLNNLLFLQIHQKPIVFCKMGRLTRKLIIITSIGKEDDDDD